MRQYIALNLFFITVSCLTTGVLKATLPEQSRETAGLSSFNSENSQRRVREKIAQATAELTQKILVEMPAERDVLISPMSLFRVIWGDYFSAVSNEDQQKLLLSLNLDGIDPTTLMQELGEMLDQNNQALRSSSFLLHGKPLWEEFKEMESTKKLPMRSDVEEQINQIVEQQTEGFLQKPFAPGDLYSKDLAAVMTNILFFKGSWQEPFSGNRRDHVVLASGEEVESDVMYNLSRYSVISDEEGNWLFLPYKDEAKEITSVLYVPYENVGKEKLVEACGRLSRNFQKYQKGATKLPVELLYPRIEAFSKYTDLAETLQRAGIALDYRLEKLMEQETMLSKLLQVSKLEDTEGGTTAAAVTAGAISLTSYEPFRHIIDCRKPFIRFIVGPSGEVLFAHTVAITDEFLSKTTG